MHLWKVTFAVGDFGRKTLTVTTKKRAYDPQEQDGGFFEAEFLAGEASQQETTGWPNPIEIIAIEYVDEINQFEPDKPAAPQPNKPAKPQEKRKK